MLTYDLAPASVCRVHLDPQPAWIIERRRAIGKLVQLHREHANLSQEQLGLSAEVTRLTVQRIESGATDARVSWLLRIAKTLDIPVDRFFRD
ncbi:helix-turn-helix domain-containing protein [Streptomyces sp. ASQP_92]|uniref:helix-turn-helix transcriptional regulator n=1 Tax=Streptomyces sp. ASQP_92 TaxID=2979116 RepID=UPI0021C1CF54|nr:helix-turn-helix transcriptional regulator [Streptomyces sp. ASQP_92]MCT9092810.1 helix-turn-helix domain-containing protein [Streptomyces sp. ASQP_92]